MNRLAALTIENAGDNAVGIVNGETSNEIDGVFVGADTGGVKPIPLHTSLTFRER